MESELTNPAFTLVSASSPSSVFVARPVGTVLCLLTADACALGLAVLISIQLRDAIVGVPVPSVAGIAFFTIFLCICSFVATQLYPVVCDNPVDELRRTSLAITLSFLSLGAFSYIAKDLSHSRVVFLLTWVLSMLLVPLFRMLARETFAGHSWWGCPVVILGMGETGTEVLQTLRRNPRLGLKPVAILDDQSSRYARDHHNLITGSLSSCLEITQKHRISYGIICMPGLSREELLRILHLYGPCFSHVMVIPDLRGMATLGISVREVGGIIGLEVAQRLLRPSAQLAKRTLDVLFTLALAPAILPLVATAALLVRLESKGPAFFGNERIGFRGKPFTAWKIRSMVVNGDEVLQRYLEKHPEERETWESTQKLKRDPRITRVGRIIRKTSIDELPQFWNVLCGEMSVVGPRPFLRHQIAMYGTAFELYKRVRPGITGMWQISGRNHLTFQERARLDTYVIQNWSVWLDLYIIARTTVAVITARGAY